MKLFASRRLDKFNQSPCGAQANAPKTVALHRFSGLKPYLLFRIKNDRFLINGPISGNNTGD
jgi:hypothetical protein